MTLTRIEQDYLADRPHGCLATVAPDGTPQNKPVGFRYNAETGTIDIHGFDMEKSAKYLNLRANPHVAFVVDDVVSEGRSGVRFLEIRGRGEPATEPASSDTHISAHFIRVHPQRVIGWNIDPAHPGLHARDVPSPAPASNERAER